MVGGTVNFLQPGANPNTGTAASFPDNGHIDVPYAAALNPGAQGADMAGSFTVALWANSTDNTNHNSPFTAREDNGVSVNGPIIYNLPNGNWSYWAGNGGGPGAWNAIDSGSAVPLNTWQHVAITYDSATTTRKMFIDGVEVINDVTGMSANLLRDIHIGSGQDDGNNFFWNGLIDDVGLWDEALDQATIQNIMTNGIASGLPDPALGVANPIELALDGTVQQFPITVTNNGATQNLTISMADFTGDPNFSVVSLPGAIGPGATGDIIIEFDPEGANGAFEAELEITSNDAASPMRTTVVRGSIHDPMIVAGTTLDLGTSTSGSLAITNDGATRVLNIAGIDFAGGDTANFQITAFPASLAAGGGTGNIDVTFDPQGGEGTFEATIEIATDDPINPTIFVDLIASVPFSSPLIAWWPLDVDGTDASGNGFNGTVVGTPLPCPGANGATAGSLEFDGIGTRIDVPYDPALNPDDFTLTMWANADTTSSFASPITNRDDVAGPITHGFIIYNDSDGLWNFWTGDGDAGWDALAGPPVATATWTHLAISYDSATDTKTLYVDGDVAATDNIPQSGVAQYVRNGTIETEDLHIGAGEDAGGNWWFDGKIDDIGYWRTALSEGDIETIMENGVAGFTGAADDMRMLPLEFGPEPGQITLRWTSQNGAKYALDRSTDMTASGTTPGSWEELDDDIDGTGDVTTFVDTPPPGAKRLFYRARRL